MTLLACDPGLRRATLRFGGFLDLFDPLTEPWPSATVPYAVNLEFSAAIPGALHPMGATHLSDCYAPSIACVCMSRGNYAHVTGLISVGDMNFQIRDEWWNVIGEMRRTFIG